MSQFFTIHPENPQARIINQVVESLKEGAVIAYPTDSAYALGCQIGNKEALSRIRNIRKLGKDHNFTLICKDFSEISKFAVINNSIYRLLKAYTPGPFTFILRLIPIYSLSKQSSRFSQEHQIQVVTFLPFIRM